ncbi:cytochrome b/b6 domain-containing protein [Paludibacterium paludis]|nr:cytochrome b/b6 domain-containing protein [Paludibacterium paludis]
MESIRTGRVTRPTAVSRRRVVDAPVRMFHGLFAVCFAGAWLTAESELWRTLHVSLGYSLAGLLGFRLVYGCFGPRPASLRLLVGRLVPLAGLIRNRRAVMTRPVSVWRPLWHGLMSGLILVVLLGAVPVCLSGYLAFHDAPEWVAEWHDMLAEIMLAMVLGHVVLVALGVFGEGGGRCGAMLTGRVPGSGPDLVRKNRTWLALVLLLVVLGYNGYVWLQSRGCGEAVCGEMVSVEGARDGEHD